MTFCVNHCQPKQVLEQNFYMCALAYIPVHVYILVVASTFSNVGFPRCTCRNIFYLILSPCDQNDALATILHPVALAFDRCGNSTYISTLLLHHVITVTVKASQTDGTLVWLFSRNAKNKILFLHTQT